MNIFGVGTTELALIFLIMLIVAGPKRMLLWSRVLGRWMAQLRRLWIEAVDQVQREMDEAGVDVKLPRDVPTRANVERWTRQALRPVTEAVEEDLKPMREESRNWFADLGGQAAAEQRDNPVVSNAPNGDTDQPAQSQYGSWSVGGANGQSSDAS